jgi:hypothetical protein
MREKLNSNPAIQIALLGLLAIGAGFLLLGGGGGGGEEESAAAPVEASATEAAAPEAAPAETAMTGAAAPIASVSAAASTIPAPPLPAPVLRAYNSSKTVVLLIVRGGGIDDRFVARSVHSLSRLGNVETFVTRAKRIARYAAITLGVDVDRVPALIVVRPRQLSHGELQASVSYGYQSSQSVVQAVRDASYKGPEPTYHPN